MKFEVQPLKFYWLFRLKFKDELWKALKKQGFQFFYEKNELFWITKKIDSRKVLKTMKQQIFHCQTFIVSESFKSSCMCFKFSCEPSELYEIQTWKHNM